jgi:hypothetical protein
MHHHQRTPKQSKYSFETYGEYTAEGIRSSTPMKSRADDKYEISQHVHRNDKYFGQNPNRMNQVRRKSTGYLYENSDEDTENVNIHQARRKESSNSSKKKNKYAANNTETSESPMTWLYDKIIGGNTSPATESLTTKKRSNHRQQAQSYHRATSTKRTMRV